MQGSVMDRQTGETMTATTATLPGGLARMVVHPKLLRTGSTWVDLTKENELRDAGVKQVEFNELIHMERVLILDLSIGGVYTQQEFNTIHVSFPSTLLRRARTSFIQLVSTLQVQTQTQLREAIKEAHDILLFDNCSTMNNCLQQTHMVLQKILPFLKETKDTFGIGLLQARVCTLRQNGYVKSTMATPTSTSCPPFKIDYCESQYKQPKHPSLTLQIPSTAKAHISSNGISQATSMQMFIQSIKRDVVHYSPNSLKKYFIFRTPPKLPKHVPKWLVPYNTLDTDVLTKIMDNFEILEDMEVKRLEKCLISVRTNPDVHTSNNSGCIHSNDTNSLGKTAHKRNNYNKYYSLRQLQKQYKPNRSTYDSDDDNFCVNPSHVTLDDKLRMDIKEELNDTNKTNLIDKLNSVSPGFKHNLSIIDGDTLKQSSLFNKEVQNSAQDLEHEKEEEVIIETPLSSYQMTNGIDSFMKNRYSNILPYEHSRVKLQPSPILPEEDNTCTISTSDSTPILNNLQSSSTHSSQELSLDRDQSGKHNVCTDEDCDQLSYFSQNISPLKRACTGTSNFDDSITNSIVQQQKEPFNDYFNANYLRLPQINSLFHYIATQAPLPSTIDDFWNVVLSNELKVIVSLNSYDELDLKKWDIYWNVKTIRKHSVEVVSTYEDVLGISGCILRVIRVSKVDADSKNSPTDKHYHMNSPKNNIHTVYQLHYTKWLDSCGINMKDFVQLFDLKNYLSTNADALLDFLNSSNSSDVTLKDFKHSNKYSKGNKPGSPILVHCSAGCGRTGVFITLDFLLSVLDSNSNQSNKIDVWNMSSDLIFIVVNELRKQRISMVQNMTQYLTCYESMLEYFYLLEDRCL